MGEAAKQIPQEFRNKYPQIPFREIAGMRDRVIHGYLAVNYNIVWDTITVKVPELNQQLKQMLDALQL